MFKITKTTESIQDVAWSYFKSDQIGPKQYENVKEVVAAIEAGTLKPLVCWSNGEVSWSTDRLEVWVNDIDQVNLIPKKSKRPYVRNLPKAICKCDNKAEIETGNDTKTD